MRTSNRSGFPRCSRSVSATDRTAGYGPVRTVVWQGAAGDRRPYADLVGNPEVGNRDVVFEKSVEEIVVRKLTLGGEDYRGVCQSPMLFILCMKRSERSHLRRR